MGEEWRKTWHYVQVKSWAGKGQWLVQWLHRLEDVVIVPVAVISMAIVVSLANYFFYYWPLFARYHQLRKKLTVNNHPKCKLFYSLIIPVVADAISVEVWWIQLWPHIHQKGQKAFQTFILLILLYVHAYMTKHWCTLVWWPLNYYVGGCGE